MSETWEEAPQVRDLELRFLQPAVRRSAAALDQLLDESFVEFGSNGRRYDKGELVQALSNEPNGCLVSRSVEDLRVSQLAPDIALVTYSGIRRDAKTGRVLRTLRSSTWQRRAGGWRMVFHQCTVAR